MTQYSSDINLLRIKYKLHSFVLFQDSTSPIPSYAIPTTPSFKWTIRNISAIDKCNCHPEESQEAPSINEHTNWNSTNQQYFQRVMRYFRPCTAEVTVTLKQECAKLSRGASPGNQQIKHQLKPSKYSNQPDWEYQRTRLTPVSIRE